MTQETNSIVDSVLTKEVTDKVFSMIEQLAGVFGSTSSEIWRIYVIQSYRLAAGELLVVLFCLFFMVICFKVKNMIIAFAVARNNPLHDSNELSGNIVGTNVIFAIIITIVSICFVVQLNDMIGYLINPEFYAIQNVVGTFTKK